MMNDEQPTPLWLLAMQMGLTIDQLLDVLVNLGWIERTADGDFRIVNDEAVVPLIPGIE